VATVSRRDQARWDVSRRLFALTEGVRGRIALSAALGLGGAGNGRHDGAGPRRDGLAYDSGVATRAASYARAASRSPGATRPRPRS